jgi:putative hemolysin
MEAQTTILTAEELQKFIGIKGFFGRFIAKSLLKLFRIDEANRIQNKYRDYTGPEFSARVLEECGVSWEIPQEQLSNIPAEGGFITISNHSYGSIDGMILSCVVGSRRPDYKILTTFLLSLIPSLRDSFLAVDNFSSGGARSIQGIRQALGHLASDCPLGLFPAGEVATWQKKGERTALGKGRVIEDRPWADNIIKLIRRSGMPVVPIYFDGGNSKLFHLLGCIHPRLRTVRLVQELFNKRGTCVKVRIGRPILPVETEGLDLDTYGKYLRSRCYALESECRETPVHESMQHAQPVAPETDKELVRAEIERISDRMLFENAGYRCYLTRSDDVPSIMKELSRLRELTFRAVGEGTGNACDTDKYDSYYYQLILWHMEDACIAGAYRIGVGSEIMAMPGGASGFYTTSLFRYKPGTDAMLRETVELGRSFVLEKYQGEFLPLRLLLTGIVYTLLKFPDVKYMIGPVSLSSSYPDLYKSLIVRFFMRAYGAPEKDRYAEPTHPLKENFLRVDPDPLLASVGDADALDKLIVNMSGGAWRLPPLMRAYVAWGARMVCFNVDPDFNDSVDGLIHSRLSEFPERMIKMLFRSAGEEELERIIRRFS